MVGNYVSDCPSHSFSFKKPLNSLTRLIKKLPFIDRHNNEITFHKVIGNTCFECKLKHGDILYIKTYTTIEEGPCKNSGHELYIGNRSLYNPRLGRVRVDIFKVDDPTTYTDNVYSFDPQNPIGYIDIDPW